ncbi:MAG: I78 family peptidase inhibitor [Lysobacteraceae bacterium]|jgi:hypothetical protein
MVRVSLIAVLAVGLAGCQDPPPPHDIPETGAAAPALPPPTLTAPAEDAMHEDESRCDASRAQWAVGELPTEEVMERARADAGVEVVRTIGHDEMVTLEYHESRLNLDLDEDGRIRAARCG